ncbi:MAG: hypothetical protein K2J13_02060 [Clostridia bacterium]|nr:hypothetical protein [Clostridia bacterium]
MKKKRLFVVLITLISAFIIFACVACNNNCEVPSKNGGVTSDNNQSSSKGHDESVDDKNDASSISENEQIISLLSSNDKRAIINGTYGSDSESASNTYYGVGRTLNVITDEYVTLSAGYKKVFDVDKLVSLNWHKTNVGKMNIISQSGSSMKEFYASVSAEFNKTISAGANIDGLFSANCANKFAFTSGANYKNTANEFFYQSSQIYASNLIEIDEYYDLDQFSSILSQNVLTDALAVEKGQMNAENFIYKYGTHVVLAGYYGGRLDFNYYLRNTSTQWNNNLAISFQNKVEAVLRDVANAKSEVDFDIAVKLGVESDTVYDRLLVSGIGGDNFSAQSIKDYFANYYKWVDSLNKKTEYSCIVGLPTRSLAAIWDILPSKYSKAKKILSQYFLETAKSSSQEFLSKYERNYTTTMENGNTQEFSGGYGTFASPYLISNATQFANISKYKSSYFKLVNSINLGIWNSPFSFTGSLNGDGYMITYSQKLTQTGSFLGGLFSSLDSAKVNNLKLNVTISRDLDKSGTGVVGALAGRASGVTEISRVYTSGEIAIGNYSGYDYVGGIIGQFYGGSIDQCANEAKITDWARNARTGGIVGYAQGEDSSVTIMNCYNKGNLKSSSNWTTAYGGRSSGGIAGQVKGAKGFRLNIINCYNDSKVTLEWTGVATGGWYGRGAIFGDIASGNSENIKVENCVWNKSKCDEVCNCKKTYTGTVGKTNMNGTYDKWSTYIWTFSNNAAPQLTWLL